MSPTLQTPALNKTVLAPSAETYGNVPAKRNGVGSKPQRFYRPELDVLRAVAFLFVFLHHSTSSIAPSLSHCGAFGLSLFFLLSAFLITELLQREVHSTGTINLRSFYVRRCLRIWPLYFGFLLLSFGVGVLFPQRQAPAAYVLSFVFMVGNIYVGRHDLPYVPSLFLWSISVEEQFYLFWPLMNRHLSRRALSIVAVVAFPVAAVTILILARHPAREQMTFWMNSLVEFQMFAGGVLLSLLLKGRIPRLTVAARTGLLLGGLSLWFAAARWSGIIAHYRGPLPLLAGYPAVCLGAAAIFFSIYGISSVKLPRAVIYAGKISYGLYVFHKLCLETVAALLRRIPATDPIHHHAAFGVGHVVGGLLLTFIMASLSYRFFEKPFLLFKDRLAIVPSRAA